MRRLWRVAVTATALESITVRVAGRPAPQGSKRTGSAGQLLEASPYLAAWRAAVKSAVYGRYRELELDPDATKVPGWALLRGPVGIVIEFRLQTGQRIDSAPDLDKLERATWDALTKARVWEDDGRVVYSHASKRDATDGLPVGAWITVVRCPQWTDIDRLVSTSTC